MPPRSSLRRSPFAIALTAIVLVSAASIAVACSVPVYRFALEQWAPDNFQVFVFHDGPLSPEQQALIHRIEPADPDSLPPANAWVETVDIAAEDDRELLELWNQQRQQGEAEKQPVSLPWMVARSPARFGPPKQILAAELSEESVSRLLDSPARQSLTQKLLKGESAVWVLLESGDKAADDAAAEVLSGELARLQQELELPPISQKDIDDGFLTVSPEDLKIRFSMVRVSRSDPREQAFVEMLLNVEPDLREPQFVNQVMALPVFGRGRALYALIGRGINSETIEDSCRFLTGACQCTVKAQNPGVDLLTTARWDDIIKPALRTSRPLPELTGLSGFGSSETSSQPAPATAPAEPGTGATPAASLSRGVHPQDDSLATVPADDATVGAAKSDAREADQTTTAAGSPDRRGSSTLATNVLTVFGGLAAFVVVVSLLFARRTV